MSSKSNSKRGQVRTAFQAGGEDAALAKGAELGIPATKIKRWCRKFGVPRAESARHAGRRRVYAFEYGDEECLATVVQEGPEDSLIRYDRPDLFGPGDRAISNKHIFDVETGR